MTPEKKLKLLEAYSSLLKIISESDISEYSAIKIFYPMNIILTDKLFFKCVEIMKECGIETTLDFQEPKIDIIKNGTQGHIIVQPNIETSILNQILKS